MTNVYRIFVEAAAGATVPGVARDAFTIAEKLGMDHNDVIFIHNDRCFTCHLKITEVEPPTMFERMKGGKS